MEKIFYYSLDIFTEDTDFGGVVYHANYLKYMDRARTAWLSEIGMPIDKLIQASGFFIIRAINIEYLRPAKLGDRLEVTSQAIEHGKSSLLIEHIIRDNSKKDCIFCTGEVKLVFVNHNIRPKCIPPEVAEKIL